MTHESASTSPSSNLHSPIGLVAGSGNFPLEFATNARAQGIEVVAIAHRGETDPALESLVSRCIWIRVGELGKMLKGIASSGVREVTFVGGISRVNLFKGARPDMKALSLIARVGSIRDDVILRGIASEVEKTGVRVVSCGVLLGKSLARRGLLTKRAPTPDEYCDATLGWKCAKEIGQLDIGQTVIVSAGVVVAVEAIEGTDAAIKRAGELARGSGVVVKVSKPQQDIRLDLPAVGENTIRSMVDAGLRVLILEDERALILNPDQVVKDANAAGISILVATGIEELRVA